MQVRDQTRFQQAQQAAAACQRLLKERYGVREVHLFGSLAGQSPWHSRSDIDLAVEGLAPERYFRALSELWDLLPEGMELDLVTLEDAPPELVARISSSSINLSAMKDVAAELATQVQEVKMSADAQSQSLKEDIQDQLVSLARIAEEAKQLLHRLPGEPTFVEIRAAGSIVHDFYSGVERIFERIAVTLGQGFPLLVLAGLPFCFSPWKRRPREFVPQSLIMILLYNYWITCASVISFGSLTAMSSNGRSYDL